MTHYTLITKINFVSIKAYAITTNNMTLYYILVCNIHLRLSVIQ